MAASSSSGKFFKVVNPFNVVCVEALYLSILIAPLANLVFDSTLQLRLLNEVWLASNSF